MNQANQVASRPLQLYQGPMVAGFTPQQMSAFNEINNAQGEANPYLNTASQYYANANTPLATEAQQDMSPYTSSVVNATQQEFNNQNQQQSAALTGNAIASGAYGGDRSGVAQAALAGQQQTAQAPVIAGLENQGYQTGLQAAEAQNQMANQAGFGMGYLGNEAENTALQGASAQLQAGGLQQQLAQEELNIPYQQFEESQQYPFQTTQWLGNLAEGLGSLSGGTSMYTPAQPSLFSELGGLGMMGLSSMGGKGTGGRIPAWTGGRMGRDYGGPLLPLVMSGAVDPTAGLAPIPVHQSTIPNSPFPSSGQGQQQSNPLQMGSQIGSQIAKTFGQNGSGNNYAAMGNQAWGDIANTQIPDVSLSASDLSGLEAGIPELAAMMARGGGVPGFAREHRDFGGSMMPHLHRPHFGVMRMRGMRMPHPHLHPSMHMAPAMHGGFGHSMGMHLPGMGVPTSGINGPMGGVPNAGMSPVPGFGSGGGVSLAKGPSGVAYPVLPTPGNSGPVNVNPTFNYSPPNPSTWQSATAPGTGFQQLPNLNFNPLKLPNYSSFNGPGWAGLGLDAAMAAATFAKRGGRIGHADGGDSAGDDNYSVGNLSGSGLLSGFSGMGSVTGFGGMGPLGPVTGPQYAAMLAPYQAEGESEAGAHAIPNGLAARPASADTSPVPKGIPLPIAKPDLPHFDWQQPQPQAGFSTDAPMAGSASGDSEIGPDGSQQAPQGQGGFFDRMASNPMWQAGLATLAQSGPFGLQNVAQGMMQGQQVIASQRAAAQKAQLEQAQTQYQQEHGQAEETRAEAAEKSADDRAKQLDAMIDRWQTQDTERAKTDSEHERHDRAEEGLHSAEIGKPNYTPIGTNANGEMIAIDSHSGKQINLGKLGPKPSATQPTPQPLPWQQTWGH